MTDPPSYRQGWCLTHVSSGNICWIGRHPDILISCVVVLLVLYTEHKQILNHVVFSDFVLITYHQAYLYSSLQMVIEQRCFLDPIDTQELYIYTSIIFFYLGIQDLENQFSRHIVQNFVSMFNIFKNHVQCFFTNCFCSCNLQAKQNQWYTCFNLFQNYFFQIQSFQSH